MRRSMLLAALCAAFVLAMAPAVMAQQQASPGLPLDQYGCVPQQTYVPEAGGCVAIEGLAPGTDPQVIAPDTGEELGSLSSFEEESDFVPCPLGLDQYPEGTACGEGGSYLVPGGITAEEQYLAIIEAATRITVPEAPTSTTAPATAATTALPATGGPSLVLLAGALLIGAGLLLRRR